MPEAKAIGRHFTHDNTTPPLEKSVLSLLSCTGKTAIVTGAGAGIGLAVAEALAEVGANVAIWYKSNDAAIKRAEEIQQQFSVKCKAFQVDVTKEQDVQDAVKNVHEEFNGRLDIFVANAGLWPEGGELLDSSIEDYHKCMAANLDGAVHCARAAGKLFRHQKEQKLEGFSYGKFVATATIDAGQFTELPNVVVPYAVSKAAIVQLCRSLAVEWIQFAQVNSVSPGSIATPAVGVLSEEDLNTFREACPMGRLGLPHELKGIYLYLCSDASSYTTGANFSVDGGQAVI